MLSASGNFPDIFKRYLQLGVLLDCKNSRGHSAKDLTTHPEVLALIALHDKTLECPIARVPFKEKEPKHWCWVCGRFVGGKCFRVDWALKELGATEREEIDGRCVACWGFAEEMRRELGEAMTSGDEARLRKAMNGFS